MDDAWPPTTRGQVFGPPCTTRRGLAGGLEVRADVALAFFSSGVLRNWIWIVALLWMGGACLVNAVRCGRLHCYVTGPFFLLGAIGLVFYQANVFRLA